MRRYVGVLIVAGFLAGCASTNSAKDRETLMNLDREWSSSSKNVDKFASYYAPDASFYPPGMPVVKGAGPIRQTLTQIASAPGFALQFGPTHGSASGDIGYTAGTYEMTANGATEKGKYVSIWKKQPDGQWKVVEDIFNADMGAEPLQHSMVAPGSIAWGPAPPSLPPGSKLAVISGDPSKAGPFVLRAQVPAGYKVPPHWHPGDEHLTVLSGSIALGMGDAWDEAKMQSLGMGGYVAIPQGMRHSFLAKSAATFQVHGMGPFSINYVNPADDPSKK